MDKKISRVTANWLGFIVTGTIFIASGVLKSVNIYSFAQEVREYQDIYFLGFLSDYALACAAVLCSVETAIGLWSFKTQYRHLFSVIAFVLLAFFTFITGENLIFPSIFGSIESCGCFGELIHFTPLTSFMKSVLLFCISGFLLLCNYKLISIGNIKEIITDSYTYITIIASTILPIYSILMFKNLDHIVYMWIWALICISLVLFLFITSFNQMTNR